MLTNPLEQFEILPIVALELVVFKSFVVDFTVSNIVIMMFLVFFFIVFYFTSTSKHLLVIPNRFQYLIQLISNFLLDVVFQQAGFRGVVFFRFFLFIFLFVLFSNILGLVPFCFTVTSHLVAVSFVAFTSNLAFLFIGISTMGFMVFLKHFVPSAAPKVLVPLITVIEVVSYLIRTLSLSLRLFANMVAGHILLFILSSFVLKFANLGSYYLIYLPLIIMLLVYVLETGIGFIQAYVFLILLTIYIAESLNPNAH